MRPRPAGQRGADRLGARLHPGADQRLQPPRIGLACGERGEHGTPRLAHDVGEHRGELEVGVLEGLLDALDMAGLLAHELLARPEQVAHRAGAGVGHEARADQAVGEQVGEPDRVGDVGLAAGDVLHVRGVGQDQGTAFARRAPARPDASRCRWPPWRRWDRRAAPASPTGRGAPAWWSRRSRPPAGSTRRLRSGAPRRQRCPAYAAIRPIELGIRGWRRIPLVLTATWTVWNAYGKRYGKQPYDEAAGIEG